MIFLTSYNYTIEENHISQTGIKTYRIQDYQSFCKRKNEDGVLTICFYSSLNFDLSPYIWDEYRNSTLGIYSTYISGIKKITNSISNIRSSICSY
jgi:hypothetical protein